MAPTKVALVIWYVLYYVLAQPSTSFGGPLTVCPQFLSLESHQIHNPRAPSILIQVIPPLGPEAYD